MLFKYHNVYSALHVYAQFEVGVLVPSATLLAGMMQSTHGPDPVVFLYFPRGQAIHSSRSVVVPVQPLLHTQSLNDVLFVKRVILLGGHSLQDICPSKS